MNILVTRPEPYASELVARLQILGKPAWALPLITFIPGKDLKSLPQQLAQLQRGDLIFLMSRQVIKFIQSSLQHNKINWPTFVEYYTIGRYTALAIHNINNLNVYYPDAQETSEELVRLHSLQNITGKTALILRGSTGRELLGETLTMRGAKVNYCECYQRCKKYYDGIIEGQRWRALGINTVIVTSNEMLQQLLTLFPIVDRYEWLLSCRLLVVSERLAIQAVKLGWQNIDIANSANNDDLIHKLCYK
ncbi:uroporphyrinogen-III synthase [Pantoea sp. Mhis]|uniref:uroporphyrinogen-III synthase n=1 Tax=Pantoea sp. Mhis TaxID=2576759 RepID=UPI00135B6F0D|nr:uroporphyrinogen-III synthase [Pantoea sp. Mhis]MXP56417.1 uroporphyrinogen-III synthase [Pantoea sp. Mhis]